MKRSFLLFAITASLLNVHTLYPLVVGSDTAVSREATATFPNTDSNNTILGFGWLVNGFTLQDSTTTCTYDAAFPVSGNINLNGGTLYLSQDLQFANATALLGMGTILANSHLLDFCSSITSLPTNSFTNA